MPAGRITTVQISGSRTPQTGEPVVQISVSRPSGRSTRCCPDIRESAIGRSLRFAIFQRQANPASATMVKPVSFGAGRGPTRWLARRKRCSF